jgi:two-component system, cell cycle response regulator
LLLLSRITGPAMDDKSDTQIYGALAVEEPPHGSQSPGGSARPMYLIVVGGGIPGAMIRLAPEGAQLGRSSENSVRVPDLSISRRHAVIGVDDHGSAWLTDLGSTNGTYLNNRRIAPHHACRLEDGDRIQLGSSFVVKFVGLDPCDEQFQREMFERTVRDTLTGLYNRAYFLDQLGPAAETGAARGLGLAVLMLDVDHFKAINDNYGHDAGDAVLKDIAQVLRECTRSEDLVARYGGEEFVVALTVNAPDQATERAERIRAAIASRRCASVCAGSGQAPRVTASIGLAFARPGRTRNTSALITAADHGLYQAKRSGRNRVVLAADPPLSLAPDSQMVTPASHER